MTQLSFPQREQGHPASHNTASTLSFIRMLDMQLASGILTPAEAAQYADMRKNELRRFVKSYHRYKIAYDSGKERYYTKHPADYHRRIYAKTEAELYERLYELYTSDPSLRNCRFQIGVLFEEAIGWVGDTQNKSEKTLALHRKDWDRYFANSNLAEIDIRDVTPNDYYDAFVAITKDGALSRKRFSDLLVCFTYIYEYANIVCCLGVTSPLSSPLFKKLKFKEEDGRADEIKTQALTKPQVAKLIAYCEAEPTHAAPKFRERIRMNRLGIHLDIYLGLRFGELFGLRWSDIREDAESGLTILQVSGQRLPNGEWVNFTKKHTDEGLRTLVLIPEAVAVLKELRAMSLDDTYVFLWSKTAYTNFQRECKRAYAHVLGLKYSAKADTKEDRIKLRHYSTHTNRTTFASIMYDSGQVTDRQLQQLMGHTTSDMTSADRKP